MFLARMVTRAKWEAKGGLEDGELPADAVTIDLRTTGNTLSFWRCGDASPEALERAVLALAAGRERLDRVDLTWVDVAGLDQDDIALARTPGKTPVASMVDEHIDAANLDYARLGRVARRVEAALRDNRHRRWTEKQVRRLLADAVDNDLLEISGLQPGVAERVKQELRSRGR